VQRRRIGYARLPANLGCLIEGVRKLAACFSQYLRLYRRGR